MEKWIIKGRMEILNAEKDNERENGEVEWRT